MNDRQLRYALAVRDELSFSRAAERLRVAQPSVSAQVRLLEHEVGFPLFRRTGRGVDVTQLGRVFMRQAEEAMAGLNGLRDLARQLRRGPLSGFAIGLSSGIAQFLVPLVMEALRPSLAEIQLSVVTAMTPRIQRLMVQEVLDAGVTVQISPRSSYPALHWETVASVEIGLFTRSDHRLARRKGPFDIVDIAHEPLIINEPHVGYGALVQSMFTNRGLSPNIVAVADHVDTIKMMIRSGVGIALLPSVSAIPEVEQGDLVHLDLQPHYGVSLCLIRHERITDHRVEKCIALVRETLHRHRQAFDSQDVGHSILASVPLQDV